MLTAGLIRVRTHKKTITPSYLKGDTPKTVELARELIELYVRAVAQSWTREELEGAVKEISGDRTDHKTIKGVARVIEDTCEFSTESEIPPVELRAKLFAMVAANPTRAAAREAYSEAAISYGLGVEQVKEALYSDRKQEQRIISMGVPEDGAEWLINRYNVALVQSLLLRCEELTVELDEPSAERLRQLFRHTQFRGLMYRIEPREGGFTLHLDGPTSLLKLSTRYGMALANWFPALLLQTSPWELKATIRWTKRRLRKELTLSSSLGLASHVKDTGAYQSRTAQWLEERWGTIDSDWEIRREAAPINLNGESVVVPDFSFHQGGRSAHLEIVGIWRRAWLKRRIKQLKSYSPGNLVLAVSTKLAGSKEALAQFPGQVIYFKEVIPTKDLIEALDKCAK
jgi:predicted nuclease of restriction endonuclease-like RecB superfamily